MNTKKWLALGLSVALAATAALAACAPTEPNTPDEGDNPSTPHTHTYTKWDYSDTEHWKVCPDDGELDVSSRAPHKVNKATHTCECGYQEPHDHTYTQWAHDANQHWKVCPDDKAIDETTRADHSFDGENKCECGYQKPEVYLTGNIASKPASGLPETWKKLGKDVTEEVRKNCIRMELGEDGETYETEILLSSHDHIRIYNTATGNSYPNTMDSINGARVEEDNGYIVSWKPGDSEPTFRVHDHDFTAYGKDENQHWKICSLDGTAEPDAEKQDHDFTNGDCVCGQKAPEGCQHENGFAFAYETLPECNAEGGTLQKTCPDCSATEDVHYDKGLGVEFYETTGPKTVLTSAGTYYLRGVDGFRFETTQAGTYTIRFAGKLRPAMDDVHLYGFHIGSSYSPAIHNTLSAIAGGQTGSKYDAQISAYNVVIDGYQSGAHKQFNSLTFTVKDTDVADSKQVCLQIEFKVSNLTTSRQTDGYLITIECPAPAAASSPAPAEVALVPERKD